MRFGIRRFSLKKRIAARTSVKRYVRHNLGLKAPRGWGWLTNPRKAAYNRIYNRTTIGADKVAALVAVAVGALVVGIYRFFHHAIRNRRWGRLVLIGIFGLGLLIVSVMNQAPPPAPKSELPPFQAIRSPPIPKAERADQRILPTVQMPRACVLRSQPEATSVEISRVGAASAVGLLEVKSGWRRVRLASGIEGWMGPKCWLRSVDSGLSCREHSDCVSEYCVEGVCR